MSSFSYHIVLIFLLAVFTVHGQLECRYAVGDYRNCTCGVQYRIVEKRCCSPEECLRPQLSTENLTCTFVCENGGTFDQANRLCLCKPGYYGLCCQRETPLCGDVFVKHSGEFTSLDFPRQYPNNADCIWRISTDPNRRIVLGAKNMEFDLEPGSNIYSCNYDFVKVSDGLNEKEKCIGKFCGSPSFRRTFQTVYSTGSHLHVKFSSDFIVRKKGFKLQYSVFFASQRCGPLSIYTRPRGTITSPHHPILYRPYENCQWTIQIIPGRDVVLTFHVLDIVATMDCRYGDYLLVSTKSNRKLTHLAAFCGRRLPEPFKVSGHDQDEVLLTFKSDRVREGMGFVLTYEQVLITRTPQNSDSSDDIGSTTG